MQKQVDLTTCDKEPIHIPGSIQVHGCMLVCDASGGKVLRYSENAIEMLGLDGVPVGKTLRELFAPEAVHELLNGLAKSSDPRRPGLLRCFALGPAGEFDIACHTHQGLSLFEFEPLNEGDNHGDPLEIARALIAKTLAVHEEAALFKKVPRFLQALLGYDRVMMYQFGEDGSGKVVGEAKTPALESFLGQYFPAADIPAQARALYLQNTIRIITDSTGEKSVIVPTLDASGAPLDLSFAHLRSVSPIHLEYLRNMGVAASMSISIIVEGKLWGLIACHHYSPKTLSMSQRVAAELFGDFLSLHLTSVYHRDRADTAQRMREALDQILATTTFHNTAEEFLRESLPDLMNVLASDGIGLWMNGQWSFEGSAPPSKFVPKLSRLAVEACDNAVWATHALSERIPQAEEFSSRAAGVMAIPLSLTQPDFLFYFRKEKLQTLEWAGDPNKVYSTGPNGDRLTPRKSFAVWKETVKGQSDPWSQSDRSAANAVMHGIREVMMRHSEILSKERKKSEVRMRVLNDELNHRVKNILALIKSLVNQPVGNAESIEVFVKGLKGRILALSHAHDQVVRSDGGGMLRQLLQAELSPYMSNQVRLTGRDVGLDSRAYSVLALVIHELATNAAKYGGLSTTAGRLDVNWSQSERGLHINWREQGGPPVRTPQRQGFGSVLLQRSVPYDLQGEANVDYQETGVVADFLIPAKFVIELPEQILAAAKPKMALPADVASIAGSTVLIVEDQLVIALEAEEMLRELGVSSLTTVGTAADALNAIDSSPPDFVVLDVNLGSSNSLAVADELKLRNIPFVFATGYGDSVMIPETLRNVHVVRKPYTSEALEQGLQQAAADRDGAIEQS